MPGPAGASFGAQDADTRAADSQPPDDPYGRAAVLAAEADVTVERLQTKVDKARAQYDDAKQALADAKAAARQAHKDLTDARKGGDE